MERANACTTPILSLAEAPSHPHNIERGTFVTRDGVVQPAPAPRFSGTPAEISTPASSPEQALSAFGLSAEEISALGLRG